MRKMSTRALKLGVEKKKTCSLFKPAYNIKTISHSITIEILILWKWHPQVPGNITSGVPQRIFFFEGLNTALWLVNER